MTVPVIQTDIPVTDDPVEGSRPLAADDKLQSKLTSESLTSEEDLLLKANPFSDPRVAAHWQEVYEEAQYESRHVFDPALEWTEQEEKRIVRKLDRRVCLWACIMFFGLQVDRYNLVSVVSDNFLLDLSMNTNDYNVGNTLFYVSFLIAELPSQLVSKKIGPDRWIPTQIILWSIVSSLQCFLSGRASFYITRVLLGVLEGGFIPDLILWLSYFYTSRELPIRLSYFWTSLSITGIAISLLAFALLHLEGVAGWEGWRWLFLIEGLITLVVGIASFFMMPASAVQTKTWFRPNGWFTDREVAIVVNRVLRDDPSKGDMNNRQAITPGRLWECLKDFDLWPLFALGVIVFIPQSPLQNYITLVLKAAGFDTLTTNLLTIPFNVFHIILLIGLTRLSEWLNERTLVSSLMSWWTLPCIIALRWWPGSYTDRYGTYALVTVLLSYPYCHAILVAWVSKNSNNVGSRGVSSALYNMGVQLGTIIANFIYENNDKPLYHKGNEVLLAINLLAIVMWVATKFYYIWRNKQKDAVWNAMTPEEQGDYIKNTKTVGSRRLDFRFAH
ncbi:MFS general substrate transporter [Xylariaceae sp. FL0255]|nr:MFS general substrate transporter [Xylariaceae sp. FL0255]